MYNFDLTWKKYSVLKYSQSLEHWQDLVEIFVSFIAKYSSSLSHVLPFLYIDSVPLGCNDKVLIDLKL